jgi:hypothetical protein
MIGTGNEKGKGNGRFDCVKEVGVTRLKAERQVGSKKGAEKHLNIGMEGGQEGKSRWRKEGGGEVGVVLSSCTKTTNPNPMRPLLRGVLLSISIAIRFFRWLTLA